MFVRSDRCCYKANQSSIITTPYEVSIILILCSKMSFRDSRSRTGKQPDIPDILTDYAGVVQPGNSITADHSTSLASNHNNSIDSSNQQDRQPWTISYFSTMFRDPSASRSRVFRNWLVLVFILAIVMIVLFAAVIILSLDTKCDLLHDLEQPLVLRQIEAAGLKVTFQGLFRYARDLNEPPRPMILPLQLESIQRKQITEAKQDVILNFDCISLSLGLGFDKYHVRDAIVEFQRPYGGVYRCTISRIELTHEGKSKSDDCINPSSNETIGSLQLEIFTLEIGPL